MGAKKIIILGGGTAGWMTAAAFARFIDKEKYSISLIESDEIGTIGVGEATIPHIRYFNNMLGIDEREFLREVSATYKLGIQFENWGALNSAYIHPFGSHGYSISGLDFHHYWLAAKAGSKFSVPEFDNFSLASVMARAGRFNFPDPHDNLKGSYSYAYHIDAGKYAKFLRRYAEERGVQRIEGVVEGVLGASENGNVDGLVLTGGLKLAGDWFVDCSGFRAILIGKHLGVGFDDWSKWLPCDRAIAVPCARHGDPSLFTRATAQKWGWQWRIPLQHRTGNGVVYSSDFVSEQLVLDTLISGLDGQVLAEPNYIRFKAGSRSKCWEKNCVAIGLSSGFLEPLESTSIYLIQQGILKFLEYFPFTEDCSILRDTYNKEMELEYNRIKDFLILHYHITERDDSEFWKYCKNMQVPESLQKKINLFTRAAQVEHYDFGLFMAPSWLAVYLGQGLITGNYDSRVDRHETQYIIDELRQMKNYLDSFVQRMPSAENALNAELSCLTDVKRFANSSLYGVN